MSITYDQSIHIKNSILGEEIVNFSFFIKDNILTRDLCINQPKLYHYTIIPIITPNPVK